MKEKIPTYSICNLLGAKHCAENLFVSKLKDFRVEQKDLYFPHKHSFYQVVLFTAGNGRHSIDFQDFIAEPHQIYYMAPGQIHTWDFEDEMDGYIVNFDENFFTTFLQNSQFLKKIGLFSQITKQPTQVLKADCCIEIVELFSRLFQEYQRKSPFREDMLRSILMDLLIRLARTQKEFLNDTISTQHFTVLHTFEALIEQHFIEKRLPKDYAKLLFITPNYLNAICNAALGKAAGEVIRERVLLEAKRLIVNSDQTISEISYQLNFEDNAYFSRFFKKYVTVSPEEFRKKRK